MKRILKRVAGTILAIYLGVLVLLTFLESTLMYPAPDPRAGDWAPAWLDYEEVTIQTEGGNSICGWYCEHPNPKAVVLLCHGNGEHVASMAEELDWLRDRYEISVFAFDYRGYGKSTGKPFETGILSDGEEAHKWLADRAGVSTNEVVLWGRSLGGAVVVHLASSQGARGLILDRTFNSMVDVAAYHFPWLPVRWLLRNRYPSDQRIQQYTGPILQVHGQPDRVVPLRFGRQLFESSPSPNKVFLESDDLTHNAPWPEAFQRRLDLWLDQLSLRTSEDSGDFGNELPPAGDQPVGSRRLQDDTPAPTNDAQ